MIYHNNVKLNAVASSNPIAKHTYHKKHMIIAYVFLGISFCLFASGALAAALTQIWLLFIICGVGFIGLIYFAIVSSWHLTRMTEAKKLVDLYNHIIASDIHKVKDLACFMHLDQNGMLYILRHIQQKELYADYSIYFDVIFANSRANITPQKIKEAVKNGEDFGRINFGNLTIECPNCKATVPYENIICPYCKMEIKE